MTPDQMRSQLGEHLEVSQYTPRFPSQIEELTRNATKISQFSWFSDEKQVKSTEYYRKPQDLISTKIREKLVKKLESAQ